MTDLRGVGATGEARVRRGRVASNALLTACVVGTVVHLVWPEGPAGELSYVAVTFAAAVLAWLGVAHSAGAPRRARWLVATGLTSSAVADIVYMPLGWSGGGPDMSIADIFWLASYVALFAGLLRLLLTTNGGRWQVESLLDLGAITTLSVLAVWQYTVNDIVADSSAPTLVRLVWSSYPVLDAVLLALVARLVVNRRVRAVAGPWLVVGVLCWLFSDFGSIVAADASGAGRWLDLGWMLGAVFIGGSVGRTIGTSGAATPEHTDRNWDHSRLAIGLLPLLAPGAVHLWVTRHGAQPDPVPLFVATAALAGLAYARGTVLLGRNRQAQADLVSSQRYYSALAAHSSDAVLVIDRSGRIANENDKISAVFAEGVSIEGRALAEFYTSIPGLEAAAAAFDPDVVAPGTVHELEVELGANDGTRV